MVCQEVFVHFYLVFFPLYIFVDRFLEDTFFLKFIYIYVFLFFFFRKENLSGKWNLVKMIEII